MSIKRVPVLDKFEWQKSVKDKDLSAPPTSPSIGDRYIVASSATGDWSGHDDEIAQWNGSTWDFTIPLEGMFVFVEDENKLYYYVTSWQEFLTTRIASIGISLDGGGEVITTGIKGFVEIPYDCILTKWTLLADQTGSIKIDIWKDTYANYPPTDADSITNGNEPEIVNSNKAQETNLSGWSTVNISAGDILVFNVDSCSSITRATLILSGTKV